MDDNSDIEHYIDLGESIIVRGGERYVLVEVTHSCFQPTIKFMNYEQYKKKYRESEKNG